jgi:hypothetical protein
VPNRRVLSGVRVIGDKAAGGRRLSPCSTGPYET